MKISKDVMEYALRHIVNNGDTDIFPFPLELRFYREKFDIVLEKLTERDYHDYTPLSLVESVIPKAKFGFRVAHQPYPSDTVIYTALVCSIISELESARADTFETTAFSYRKDLPFGDEFFVPERHFKDWISSIQVKGFSRQYSHAIRTDISDYYMRIYRHRLENIAESLSGNREIVKKIEKTLATWRGGQSFGIPVGSDASRLLAETALHDADMALMSEDFEHTRYVDDIVIFVKRGQDPYAILSYLAKHLSENEGLSLNNQKTRIFKWDEFWESFSEPNADDDATKEGWATEKLFWAAYGNDELDQEALEALMAKDLVAELEEELAKPFWDMGAVRILLHAMRLVESKDAANYVRVNISKLIPFAKDVFLLLESFIKSGKMTFPGLGDEITKIISSETTRSLECARAWFLELGVRGLVTFSAANMRKLDGLSGTLDIRQLHIIRWRMRDLNYFRSRKARLNEIQEWAQPTFIFGASCLPKDEYDHWVRSIKSRVIFPLGKEFCDWCIRSHGTDPYLERDS